MSDTRNQPYSGDLVTVATFPEPAELNMARTALEGAGIPVYIQGETANSMLPVAFTAQLQVQEPDAAAARRLLAEAFQHPASIDQVTAAEEADEHDRATRSHS